MHRNLRANHSQFLYCSLWPICSFEILRGEYWRRVIFPHKLQVWFCFIKYNVLSAETAVLSKYGAEKHNVPLVFTAIPDMSSRRTSPKSESDTSHFETHYPSLYFKLGRDSKHVRERRPSETVVYFWFNISTRRGQGTDDISPERERKKSTWEHSERPGNRMLRSNLHIKPSRMSNARRFLRRRLAGHRPRNNHVDSVTATRWPRSQSISRK